MSSSKECQRFRLRLVVDNVIGVYSVVLFQVSMVNGRVKEHLPGP